MNERVSQGIFAAGEAATGLTWKRAGFGFTDEDDRLWALGWPHLFFLTPGDVPDKALVDKKAFHRTYDPVFGPELPEGLAPRLVRYYTAVRTEEATLAALRTGGPLSDDEAANAARIATRDSFSRYLIYALEAVRSPAWVLEHVIDELERPSATEWDSRGNGLEAFGATAYTCLAMVMLRAAAPDVERARSRLATLADRLAAEGIQTEMNRAYQMLLTVLGRARSSALAWNQHLLTPDDAAEVRELVIPLVEKMKPSNRAIADARLCFLGGEPVLLAYARHARQFYKDHQKALVVQLSRCAHPAVPEVMRQIGGTYGKKWLKAHGHT